MNVKINKFLGEDKNNLVNSKLHQIEPHDVRLICLNIRKCDF
jgi:hypothetical protein